MTGEAGGQDGFVDGFQKTWAEFLMDMEAAIDGDACQVLDVVHFYRSRALLAEGA